MNETRPYRVDVIRDLRSLAAHADAWDELASDAPQQLPLLSHAWVAAYFETAVTPPLRWLCLLAYRADALCGVLPLIIGPLRRPFGRWSRAVVHDSLEWDSADVLLADTPGARDVLAHLMQTFSEVEPRCLSLHLGQMREGSASLRVLDEAFPDLPAQWADDGIGHYVPTAGTYADFAAALSAHFRQNLRRGWRNLEREVGPIRYHVLSGANATPSHFAAYTDLEARGWKGTDQGAALAKSRRKVEHWARLVHSLHQRGWLEWHVLEAGSRIVAINFCIRFGRALIAVKTAYDETVSRHSPGHLLFERMLQRAFDDGGVAEVNFLTDYEYLKAWRMATARYRQCLIYPPRRGLGALVQQIDRRHHEF